MPLSELHALTWKNYNKKTSTASNKNRGGGNHLTDSEIKKIKSWIADGWTNSEVSDMADVSAVTISLIRTGKLHKEK